VLLIGEIIDGGLCHGSPSGFDWAKFSLVVAGSECTARSITMDDLFVKPACDAQVKPIRGQPEAC
jgi:hypothetical protein